jgi:hypothetical protein
MEGAGGVTAIETRVAALTMSETVGDATPSSAAVIEAAPTACAVAKPLEPLVFPIVTTAGAEELQATVKLKS